ncbi:MAG: ABC transporter ATP-binding protein [Burkholderiales bacterium]|nr:ABC transporter ATP-binding protein [Burkholderiales bacterium]
MTTALEINDIHKAFGRHKVLDGFSLRLERGEILGLLGPNGCGKSTVLNIICRLLWPDVGQISLMGQPLNRMNNKDHSLVGFCTQRCALYPDLFPAENLHFFGRIHGLSAQECQQRVAELMRTFSLNTFAETRVGQLSGGWQQRLHLAAALIHQPALLVLDEPTAAVDVEARSGLWRLIEDLRDRGVTILLTSHHLAEAERLCNKVALMRNGKVVVSGSVADLLVRMPGQAVAKVQSEDPETISQRAMLRGWTVRQQAGHIKLFLPQNLDLRDIMEALAGAKLTSLSVQPVSLDDAYLEFIGEDSLIQI